MPASRGPHRTITCNALARPAETCQGAVAQARGALRCVRVTSPHWLHLLQTDHRRYREAVAAGEVTLPCQGPAKLRIELPWPQPFPPDDAVRLLDESAWPGGVIQRFRALRPCVEGLLEGSVCWIMLCCAHTHPMVHPDMVRALQACLRRKQMVWVYGQRTT